MGTSCRPQVYSPFTAVPDAPGMALLKMDWFNPLADAGGGAVGSGGSLWVFGLVVDATTMGSGRFVHSARSPRDRSIEAPVQPIGGLATAGLVAVWSRWEGDPGKWAAHGAVAAATLSRLVARRTTAANLRDLQLGVEQDIADTVRRGWNGLGPVADEHLVAAHRLLTVDGPMEQPVDLRLALTAGEVVVPATLRYPQWPAPLDVRYPARSSAHIPTPVAGR
jgi:hypothetical protein